MKENTSKERLAASLVESLMEKYPNATLGELKGIVLAEAAGVAFELAPVGEHPDAVGSLGEVSQDKRWREKVGNQ